MEQRSSLRLTKAHCTELQEQMNKLCNWYSSAHLFVQAAPNCHVCAKTIKYKTWTASWTSKCGMRLKASFLHFGLIASSFARGSLSCRDHRLWYWAWAYAPKRVHGRWLRPRQHIVVISGVDWLYDNNNNDSQDLAKIYRQFSQLLIKSSNNNKTTNHYKIYGHMDGGAQYLCTWT